MEDITCEGCACEGCSEGKKSNKPLCIVVLLVMVAFLTGFIEGMMIK